MPFDGALTFDALRDRLFRELRLDMEADLERIFDELRRKLLPLSVVQRIGLIPVPHDVLEAHKVKVKRAFFADPRHRTRNQLAQWKELPETTFNTRYGTIATGTCAERKAFMLVWAGAFGKVPKPVPAIITETERRLTVIGVSSERVLGFFDTDPYILLQWIEHGERQQACLAIWDRGEVIDIATFRD